MLRIIFLMPLVQLFILGYAVTFDVKNVALLAIDRDATSASRGLVDRFAHNEHFVVKRIGGSGRRASRGTCGAARRCSRSSSRSDFGRSLETGRPTEVEILLDGQNSNTAGIALGYCNRIIYRFASDRAAEGLARAPSIMPRAALHRAGDAHLVQPRAQERLFHDPGDHRDSSHDHHDAAHGARHREGAGDGNPRAAPRDAAQAVADHRRKDDPLRHARHRRDGARDDGRRSLVRHPARGERRRCSRSSASPSSSRRSGSAFSSRPSPARSSRRSSSRGSFSRYSSC